MKMSNNAVAKTEYINAYAEQFRENSKQNRKLKRLYFILVFILIFGLFGAMVFSTDKISIVTLTAIIVLLDTIPNHIFTRKDDGEYLAYIFGKMIRNKKGRVASVDKIVEKNSVKSNIDNNCDLG
ncbi:MAG: hypothetical protein LBP26_00375 [Clostridiales bacterium]|jgi:hypothetical protein|nr:hypothetical protein [Clostridiales bacterium]